ncbi:MAG: GNAT family N-acetyltransferase, partial [Pseudomonadota bacterium]
MAFFLRPAGLADIAAIKNIAFETWPVAYGEILSPAQMGYMLEMMYSSSALTMQIEQKHHCFMLALERMESQSAIGFASYELDYQKTPKTKLHKLYCLPSSQGQGTGAALVHAVANIARQAAQTALTLNVNKNNKATGFYARQGFHIIGQEDIDIGEGFMMEDFIMERPLVGQLPDALTSADAQVMAAVRA